MRRIILSLALALCASGSAFAQQSMGAMPTCASDDPVVWVNASTHVYHMQGDSYYGKTKHGMYLCKSAADAKNYRAAGSHSNKSRSGAAPGTNMNTDSMRTTTNSGAAPGTNMNPNNASPMPGMMMSGKKHKHHHKNGMMHASPSPSPDMTPSPAAT